MGFLVPAWFLLGAAAAVPLLVHLLRRRSGATTEFPAARYLLRAEREHSRSIRLRNLLLMVLRILAILLIATAAARPVGRLLAGPGTGHAPTSLAIVMDNSMSTGVIESGRPAFERLRDAARTVVERATDADRIHVVTADGRSRTASRAAALELLTALAPLRSGGDLAAATRRAVAAAASDGEREPRVLVLTDGQRTAWPEELPLGASVPVTVAALDSAAPANRAVTGVRPRSSRWLPAGMLDVRLQARDSTALRVLLGAAGTSPRTVARALVAPAEVAALRIAAQDTGWQVGRVEIDVDELPADDARHFAAWVGDAPGVSVSPGAGPFVRSAIDALRAAGDVRGGDDVRVLAAEELGEGPGRLLVLAPANPAQLGAANAALVRAGIPWRFGSTRPPTTVRVGDAAVPVRRAYDLVPTTPAAAETLHVAGGRPWAVGGEAAATRYVVIASPLEPDATDLPVRAAFVPWIASLVASRLAGASGTVREVAPGTPVDRPAVVDSVVDAAGKATVVSGATFPAPPEPGVYFLRGDGRIAGVLVVNVEERESVMDRLSAADVAARMRGPAVSAVPLTGRGLARDAFAAGGRRSLVSPVLVAALLALGLEALITAVRARGTV